jgi:hypothetical protein
VASPFTSRNSWYILVEVFFNFINNLLLTRSVFMYGIFLMCSKTTSSHRAIQLYTKLACWNVLQHTRGRFKINNQAFHLWMKELVWELHMHSHLIATPCILISRCLQCSSNLQRLACCLLTKFFIFYKIIIHINLQHNVICPLHLQITFTQ